MSTVIREWPANGRETLRVSLDSYMGRDVIDCRKWFDAGDGELKPGRSGLTVAIKHLPDLADAINAALSEARRLGLVESTSDEQSGVAP